MNIESVASSVSAVPAGTSGNPLAARRAVAAEASSTVAGPERSVTQRFVNDRQAQEEKPLNIEEAAQRLNQVVSAIHPEINFTVDEESGIRVVRVIDNSTKEVIRQIPSEEMIRMAQALDKLQGLFVKETV